MPGRRRDDRARSPAPEDTSGVSWRCPMAARRPEFRMRIACSSRSPGLLRPPSQMARPPFAWRPDWLDELNIYRALRCHRKMSCGHGPLAVQTCTGKMIASSPSGWCCFKGRLIAPRGGTQYRSRFGWSEDCVNECLGLTRAQDEHGPFFDGALGRCLRAMQHEICHRPSLKVGSSLDEQLLLFIEACVKTIRFGPSGLAFRARFRRSSHKRLCRQCTDNDRTGQGPHFISNILYIYKAV